MSDTFLLTTSCRSCWSYRSRAHLIPTPHGTRMPTSFTTRRGCCTFGAKSSTSRVDPEQRWSTSPSHPALHFLLAINPTLIILPSSLASSSLQNRLEPKVLVAKITYVKDFSVCTECLDINFSSRHKINVRHILEHFIQYSKFSPRYV